MDAFEIARRSEQIRRELQRQKELPQLEILQPKSEAERIRLELMPAVDLDEEQFEVFCDYVEELQRIGVLFEDEYLQDAINGNPQNLEAAIQAVLEYADRLREKHQAFEDKYHSTNCLKKALEEGWRPHKQN